MKLLIAFLILAFTTSFSFSQALWSRAKLNTENGEKYGIILNNGTWLIEPNYDDIRVQYKYEDNGFVYFIVEQNDKLGLIDHTGKVILPIQFDVIIPYLHYIKVDVDGKEAAYSMSGKLIIDFTDQEISSLSDHKFLNISFYEPFIGFGNEDHFGVMDTSGNVIVPPNYDYIKKEGNFFKVYRGYKVNLFNQRGQLLNTDGFTDFYKNSYPKAEPDGYIMAKANGKWGVIDSLGTVVIEPIHSIMTMHLDYIEILDNENMGIGLYSGEVFSAPTYQKIEMDESERSFKFLKDGKWGIYSLKEKKIVPEMFDEIDLMSENIRVQRNKLIGIWSYDGKPILLPKYTQLIDSYINVFLHEENGLWGATTAEGTSFLPPVYDSLWEEYPMIIALKNQKLDGFTKEGRKIITGADEIMCFSDLFFQKKNKRWGAIDKNGHEVIPPLYAEIGEDFSHGVISAQKNGKWGYISRLGEVVIPFMYDKAENFHPDGTLVSKNGQTFLIDIENNRISRSKSNDLFSSGGSLGVAREPMVNGFSDYYNQKFLSEKQLKAVWSSNHVGLQQNENQLVPTEFEEIVISKHEIINVKKSGLWGTYDFNGNQILEPQFTELTHFEKLTKTNIYSYEEENILYTSKSKNADFVYNLQELRYSSEFASKLYDRQAERLSYYPRPTEKAHYYRGEEAMNELIASEIIYPKKGRKRTEKTTVEVIVYINENSTLTFLEFADPALPSYFLNEAKRVVEGINWWTSGEVNGKDVRTKITIPITFDPATYGTKTSK